IMKIVENKSTSTQKNYSLYNIGNSKPVKLMDFIEEIEEQLDIKAKKEMLPMQAGDVSRTWADVEALKRDYNYHPNTSIKKGICEFIRWYKKYYNIK
ncbi:MAG: NAD-dependent epimerase, partial [Flavobacteriaceae bacterium]|nr:NAD-dependent epimerase [Flavobacteriaceae bacterium]